ncbi:MAG: hypothetical protein ACKO8I_05520 [Cyanobacteriota bacterium]
MAESTATRAEATKADSAAAGHADRAGLEQQLQAAREEAELTLEQLHLVQEELEVYFLRSEDLQAQLSDANAQLSKAQAEAQQADATRSVASPQPRGQAAPADPAALPMEAICRLIPLLNDHLSAGELTSLAHACNQQHRHHLALPLLDAAVSKLADVDPSLAAWTQLQAVRTRLALGRHDGALRQLQVMAEQQLAALPVRQEIHRHLAWLALKKGDRDTARIQLDSLQALSADPGILEPLGQALALAAGADAPSSTRLAMGDRCGCSLDRAAVSGDGLLLLLEGWFFDPEHHLTELLLIRERQLLAISPDQLHWRVRDDLISLQGEQGLDASHAAGFTLHLALGQEEAVPHGTDEPLRLVLLRHGAEPLLLGRPSERLQTDTTGVYALVAPVLHSVAADPADVSGWAYPPGC